MLPAPFQYSGRGAGKDTYNKPFIPRGITQTYTEGTGVTKQNFTATNETLSLSTKTVYNFHLDATDMRQQKRRATILAHQTMNAMEELQTVVDQLPRMGSKKCALILKDCSPAGNRKNPSSQNTGAGRFFMFYTV